jgi:hypothetical protein
MPRLVGSRRTGVMASPTMPRSSSARSCSMPKGINRRRGSSRIHARSARCRISSERTGKVTPIISMGAVRSGIRWSTTMWVERRRRMRMSLSLSVMNCRRRSRTGCGRSTQPWHQAELLSFATRRRAKQLHDLAQFLGAESRLHLQLLPTQCRHLPDDPAA